MLVRSMKILAVISLAHIVSSVNTDLAQLYFFYGPSYVDQTVFNLSDATSVLSHPKFRSDLSTTIYIHGYTESTNVDSVRLPVLAYLINRGYNTIVLDWGELAGGLYTTATSNMVQVGERMSDVLLTMFNAGLPIEKFHLVGHSLGAQMSGIIGNGVKVKTNGTTILRRVTGLDPAGPLFWKVGGISMFYRQMTPQDAVFVDVIHTDAGFLGIATSCGTVDFWPNSGTRLQPGCPLVDVNAPIVGQLCGHQLSWRYWSESLGQSSLPEEFSSIQAESYSNFKTGNVINNRTVSMGINCPSDVSGNWYLKTRDRSPYSLGANGAQTSKNTNRDNFMKIVPLLLRTWGLPTGVHNSKRLGTANRPNLSQQFVADRTVF